jgi:hypothetical protein
VTLSNLFSAKPQSEDSNDATSPLFRGRSIVDTENRHFVNWKRILMAVILNSNPYPEIKDLKAYLLRLEALADSAGIILEDKFVEVRLQLIILFRHLLSLTILKAQSSTKSGL